MEKSSNRLHERETLVQLVDAGVVATAVTHEHPRVGRRRNALHHGTQFGGAELGRTTGAGREFGEADAPSVHRSHVSMRKQLLFLPGPVTVAQPVLEAAARPMIDHRGPQFAALLERVTGALRPVYGTSGEIAVLGSSGTGAMEAAVVNLFSPGERLLSCPVGGFGKRFAAIAQGYGCIVETLVTPLGSALDPQALRR